MGKKSGSDLGRAMIKARSARRPRNKDSWIHTSELNDSTDWNRINFQSVTEQNSLDEFLATAELAGTDFEAERLNIKFVSKSSLGVLTNEVKQKIKETQDQHRDLLRIPRRPLWKDNTELATEEYILKERDAFLEWRRKLAELQNIEHISLTPFEKNLEFWKQLWRVIEKSDVVVQIVDARNPLLFRCKDLEDYVKEVDVNKINIILINKADYLTLKQRHAWFKYFESINVKIIFWSAKLANEENALEKIVDTSDHIKSKTSHEPKPDLSKETIKEEGSEEDDDSDNDEDEDENEISSEDDEESQDEIDQNDSINDEQEKENLEKKSESIEENFVNTETISKNQIEDDLKNLNITEDDAENCKILSRDELISLFKNIYKNEKRIKQGCTIIGMVGYPNVGKSSTINALLKTKKVAVSETPGKTKHYQTLYVDDDLILCDCPGLVFPSFVATKGELILNGILPVDQMRDHCEPMNLICYQISSRILEIEYGIMLPKPNEDEDSKRKPTVEELCSTYAYAHGFMNHKGMPDVQRSARVIIKDYINGRLIYCYPPPGIDEESFQQFKLNKIKEDKYLEKLKKIEAHKSEQSLKLSKFDQEFFQRLESRAIIKGSVAGYSRIKNVKADQDQFQSTDSLSGKPWKKHNNSNKREKIRRLTTHLDN